MLQLPPFTAFTQRARSRLNVALGTVSFGGPLPGKPIAVTSGENNHRKFVLIDKKHLQKI